MHTRLASPKFGDTTWWGRLPPWLTRPLHGNTYKAYLALSEVRVLWPHWWHTAVEEHYTFGYHFVWTAFLIPHEGIYKYIWTWFYIIWCVLHSFALYLHMQEIWAWYFWWWNVFTYNIKACFMGYGHSSGLDINDTVITWLI